SLIAEFALYVRRKGSSARFWLTPPDDLFMLTLNTNYTLAWDWDQSAAGSDSATFTVQYAGNHSLKKRNPKWTTVCAETSGRSCDLTRSGLNYLGLYVVRVQTNLNGRHSVWKSLQFSPDKDAVLGPPSEVRLGVSGRTLDIFITDPQNSSNSSMKEHLNKLSYDIVYWEQPEDGKSLMPETTSTVANVVTLSSIKPWTQYCMQIRSRDDFYNKTSTFTAPLCAQTEGVVPWWKIFMYFLLSLVSCFLMVLFMYFSSSCIFFLQHEGDYPRLIVSDYESDLCDPVIVCSESAILVINPAVDSAAPPAGLDQDRRSFGVHLANFLLSSSGGIKNIHIKIGAETINRD
uniref:Fibronectin type-III domain-containing protein n=1 Tax=Xiphophorus couchianus TaxID=32473 RepID=A0A3B5M7R7_9TELE